MESLLQDIRYGVRTLRKWPGFTAVTVITLALGIGANTAIFSVVDAVLLRQLPFKNPERLVWLSTVDTVVDKSPLSIPDYIDFRDQNQVLDEMAAIVSFGTNMTGVADAERLQAARVSANLFQMMGVDAAVGRTLLPDDTKPDSQRSVVLTDGLWKRRFGGSAQLVGSTLTLNGDSYTVVGVLPPDFSFPGLAAELAVPLDLDTQRGRNERSSHFLRVVARLKPNVTIQQAQADLTSIARHLQQQYPDTNARKVGVKLVPLFDEIIGNSRIALLVLLGAVGLVLLIACANLANLSLARATTRHKEMALRLALGATRGRLIQQLLTESLLLAVFSGMLGLIAAYWTLKLLVTLIPADLPRARNAEIDIQVLAFTVGLSLLAGVFFGLVPALQSSKANLNEELKSGSRGSSDDPRRNSVRGLLVVVEVALSLILLIGAGLLIKSFLRLQEVNPGFNAENVLRLRLSFPKSRYSQTDTITSFYDQLANRIEAWPGVQSMGAVSIHPMSTSRASIDFTVEGHPPPTAEEAPAAQYRMVTSNYFNTMGIPILKGRQFTEHDTAQTAGVVIINETLARRFWPNQNPVGSYLLVNDGAPPPRKAQIVGVVGDVKQFGLESGPTMDLYVPYRQIPEFMVDWAINNMTCVVRTSGDPLTLADAVRREAQALDKDVPASSIGTMEQLLTTSVAPRRFNTLLLEIFAVAAVLLALMGIYAVMSYAVTQRRQEIGIRMALGAQQGDVVRLMLGRSLKTILIGMVVGLIGALSLTGVISSLLFGVSPIDMPTFGGISLLYIGVALVASYIPARRAMKVDPVIALRAE